LNEATRVLQVAVAPADLDAGLLEICRNGECLTANVRATDGQVVCSMPGAHPTSVECASSSATASSFQLRISYRTQTAQELKDGDQFTFRLTNGRGSPVAEGSGTVSSYADRRPNGEACNKDDSCRSGSF
jgi:hypothetical protein